ncbi:hypothetical protein [Flavobacterium solisilvae]|uniref:Type II toxin-antitoxin system Phd/YefM family antitoxin n=1 Tax=Flavobacterium solisilvae TaxID=1852019 RepID=A0ABX1QW76_9FLAO|nr:hypothetical protein [Flavobacterium solisilvae]NMH25608.1 hypothetical protein [Flavobacterium solisilvae]
MSKKDVNKTDDFHKKVMKGLKLSYERLIQSKIEKNQSVVIMRDGKVITVKASELHKL